jgi:hypothetical protein
MKGVRLRKKGVVMGNIKFTLQKSCFLLVCLLVFLITDAYAGSDNKLSSGGAVYVSIYSNVYAGPKALSVNLAAMLSIRNTDTKFSIRILNADYYDSDGNMIDSYLKEPTELKPLQSTYYYLKEADTRGGPGANFVVKWRSKNEVNKPIIEGIMTGMKGGQGISFRCPGREITEHME